MQRIERAREDGWTDVSSRSGCTIPTAIPDDMMGRLKSFLWTTPVNTLTEDLENLAKTLNIHIEYLPANATDLCQPADSFIIQKIKEEWMKRWDSKKREMILTKKYANTPNAAEEWSGKLENPQKHYFLELAAHCVRHVNNSTGKDGMSYVRKAMIRCGLALDTDGRWNESQLKPELQQIINKHRKHFNGVPPLPGKSIADI